MDDTLDMSKAVVAPVGHPDVGPNPGWGEENVPAMFRPLLIFPEVTLVQEDEELDLSDYDNLPPEVIDRIQMKARERAALNREHTEKAIRARNGLFCNMYRSLADFANSTSDTIRIFMRLYAVSDFNQWSLVKQKMATIFRADFRRALTLYNADSSQGIFGGEDHVMRILEEIIKAENSCQE